MSLSNLTPVLSSEIDQAILEPNTQSSYFVPAGEEPETSAAPIAKGWLATDDGHFYFDVKSSFGVRVTVSLDVASDVVLLDIRDNFLAFPTTQHFKVDMGAGNGKGDSWLVAMPVVRNGTDKGKWVFSKITPVSLPVDITKPTLGEDDINLSIQQ